MKKNVINLISKDLPKAIKYYCIGLLITNIVFWFLVVLVWFGVEYFVYFSAYVLIFFALIVVLLLIEKISVYPAFDKLTFCGISLLYFVACACFHFYVNTINIFHALFLSFFTIFALTLSGIIVFDGEIKQHFKNIKKYL